MNPQKASVQISNQAMETVKGINQIDFLIGKPRFIVAQFLHETGYGSSRVFQEQNNGFGMRCVYIRPTTQVGCQADYGVYANGVSSAIDLNKWFEYHIEKDIDQLYIKQGRRVPAIGSERRKSDFNDFVNRYRNFTLEQYVAYIKERGYFEDTYNNYYNGLLNAMNTNLSSK